jgi:hypothetical protein
MVVVASSGGNESVSRVSFRERGVLGFPLARARGSMTSCARGKCQPSRGSVDSAGGGTVLGINDSGTGNNLKIRQEVDRR